MKKIYSSQCFLPYDAIVRSLPRPSHYHVANKFSVNWATLKKYTTKIWKRAWVWLFRGPAPENCHVATAHNSKIQKLQYIRSYVIYSSCLCACWRDSPLRRWREQCLQILQLFCNIFLEVIGFIRCLLLEKHIDSYSICFWAIQLQLITKNYNGMIIFTHKGNLRNKNNNNNNSLMSSVSQSLSLAPNS